MEETELLARIARRDPGAWSDFLDAFADVLFRSVCRFTSDADERMDLFLQVCTALRAEEMRRLRMYRPRPRATLATYLAVVVKNLAIDQHRAAAGRFRPFRQIDALPQLERLVFDYHLRDSRPLREVSALLVDRHGIRVTEADLAAAADRVASTLSASQRWRLAARLAARRPALPVDTVRVAAPPPEAGPMPAAPDVRLREADAERLFQAALSSLPARQHLALLLRYRDGLAGPGVAKVLGLSTSQADRLATQGVTRLRETLHRSGVQREELEATLGRFWPDPAEES